MSETIWLWHERGKLKVRFDYAGRGPALVQAMKDAIPARHRIWNGRTTKDKQGNRVPNPGGDDTWIIDSSQLDVIDDLAEQFGFTIDRTADQQQDSYRTMLACLDDETMQAVYRAVEKALLRDVGASEKREKFMEGWERVKRERGMR